MSGRIQLDYHPDAESLNAFAEKALEGQEREGIAAHIAVCGRCREIVFLACEASEEAQLPQVAAATAADPERKAGFWNWRLAWIPAAALAAGITVAYVAHIRRMEEPTSQMAQVVDEAKPVVAVQPTASSVKNPTEEAAKGGVQEPGRQLREESADKVVAPIPNLPVALTASQSNGIVANAPAVTELQKEQMQAEVAENVQTLKASKAAAPSAKEAVPAQDQAIAAAAPLSDVQIAAAPPLESRAGAAKRSSVRTGALYKSEVGLPSGLAIVSSAAAEHLVLVVDKAGAVFLSTDAEAHWESIGRQWNGRAVSVRAQTKPGNRSATESSGGVPSTAFELVNDQGQIWISPDGRIWKAK